MRLQGPAEWVADVPVWRWLRDLSRRDARLGHDREEVERLVPRVGQLNLTPVLAIWNQGPLMAAVDVLTTTVSTKEQVIFAEGNLATYELDAGQS